MELDKLKLLRDSYMKEAIHPISGGKTTAGAYMKISLDGGVDIVTSKDLVTFDDDNEMLHAVCINEDMRSQASFPVKIISSSYDMIQQVETVMSRVNFEDFLNDGYLDTISSDRKNAMINWVRALKLQAQQPLEAEPYFNTNPQIIPMAHSVIEREEYIDKSVGVIGVDGEERSYESIEDAINDIRDGDNIVLVEDLNLLSSSEPVFVFDKPISATIDLNGHEIVASAATAFKMTDGSLTIKNGTIHSSGEAFRVDATAGGSPELILEEGVVVKSENDCCIYVRGAVKITSSADLISLGGNYCPIQGNGNAVNAGSEINLIGGSIMSEGVAIYQPQNGILNISNCSIRGTTAIYVKSGTVNIESGYFVGTGDATPYKVNNNGCNPTGDAIVVDFCNYPGGMPVVNISGGEFTSINAKGFETYNNEGYINPADAKTNVNISGGSFKNELEPDYLVDGYTLNQNDVTKLYDVIAG